MAAGISNPYTLAQKSLDAYRAQDLAAWNALREQPVASPAAAFPNAALLRKEDRIQGLYFLDGGKTIAALVRRRAKDHKALWFRIRRVPAGFVVDELVAADVDPPTDVPVEG